MIRFMAKPKAARTGDNVFIFGLQICELNDGINKMTNIENVYNSFVFKELPFYCLFLLGSTCLDIWCRLRLPFVVD